MKKNTRIPIKLTAWLLMLAMMLCVLPLSAFALEETDAEVLLEAAQPSSASPSQEESSLTDLKIPSDASPNLGLGELSTEELAKMEVKAEEIPEVIPMAKAKEKQLVNRLYAQETSLSTVLFQTKSGNKTAYVFDKPVKYVTADGAVRDKSTAISEILDVTYAYAMQDNSVKVYFPRNVSSGVLLSYDDYSITMMPELEGKAAPVYDEENNSVGYAGIFGKNTILTYTPTLYGVKEDIVLVKYEGKSSFDFIMSLEGLTALQNANGVWELYGKGKNAVASLGNVVVKDAVGKTAYGELNVEALGNGQYRVTVIAPEAFLTAEDTVYPVYVDPTITIEDKEEREYYDDEGYFTDGEIDTIIDVGLYQTSADYNRAVNYQTEHYLGQYNGNGRIIYKFYDFYSDDGEFTHLSSGQIGRVTMYLSSYDEPSQNVLVRPMTATWDASIYGDNPIALLNSSVNLWNSVSGVGMSSFDTNGCSILEVDVTQIAKGWADYNRGVSSEPYNNPANGFCLSADNIYYSYIMATEGDTVYYEIEYGNFSGDYYLISKAHGDIYEFYMPYMEEEDDYLLSSYPYEDISDLDDAKWTFECCGDNLYYIRLASDPTCVLYGCGTSIFATQLVEGNPYHQWEIIQSGLNCYIKNKGDQKYLCYRSMGSYYAYQLSATAYGTPEARWELLDADIFTPLTDISLDSEWLEAGTTKNFNVVASPANASHTSDMYFTWELSNSDFTVDTSGRITANTYAGDYSYLTLTHKYTGISKTFMIVTELDIEGTYVFQNAQTELFMEVNPSASNAIGATIQQGDYQGLEYEKWNVTMFDDRTFSIRSLQSGLYLQNAGAIGGNVVQAQSQMKWKITITSNGNWRITPVTNIEHSLNSPNAVLVENVLIIQGGYTDDTNYFDEWEPLNMLFSIVNYYDDSLSVSQVADIEVATQFVVELYKDQFNIDYQIDSVAQENNSFLNGATCATGAHIDALEVYFNVYNSPRENSHVYTLWTNNPGSYCMISNSNQDEPDDSELGALAFVVNHWPVIMMTDLLEDEPYDGFQTALMSINLAHEMAHTLGYDDVYNNEGHDSENYQCIMSKVITAQTVEFYNDIISGEAEPFCPSCRAGIAEKAQTALYFGN